MEVWTEPMNRTNSSTGSVQRPAQHPPLLPPAKQTSHFPLTHSFTVTPQHSHLPPQSWVLLLLHHCLQPHQKIPLCDVVWEQSSYLKCEQDKGDDCGF